MNRRNKALIALTACLSVAGLAYGVIPASGAVAQTPQDKEIQQNISRMIDEGRHTFRYDTFGDEAFWGDTLKLHQAIEGSKHGGVGDGVSPNKALEVGLKVDMDALPTELVDQIKAGKVNLDDPATTLALLKINSVIGVTGFFNPDGTLKSIGIQCALCHSTVDDAFKPGIGHRLDGFANRDLNVGAIVNLSPDLSAVVKLLQAANPKLKDKDVRNVLNGWGPGKFDAELFLDGKATNPQQMTNGVVTGTNVTGATLLPNAFGLAGFNQHTWSGAWGNVSYWNAFVANIEMHGVGTFYDPRLDNAGKYPVAAAAKFGHLRVEPNKDRISLKLPALHIYQLAIPAPKPTGGVDFDKAASARGSLFFLGKGKCVTCHVSPLSTEPGYNLHKPEEIKIDGFQANRGPDNLYKTMNLSGLFVTERGLYMRPENRGRFYHDGRFATLRDVVKSYNERFALKLAPNEQDDLVEYLKSL